VKKSKGGVLSSAKKVHKYEYNFDLNRASGGAKLML
jgi:hypothetical protein